MQHALLPPPPPPPVLLQTGDAFVDVTADALPAGLRASLECRVEDEEAAAAAQQVGLYYHEGFKRKVYSEAEVGAGEAEGGAALR